MNYERAEEVYDNDGNFVLCPDCKAELKWIDKIYICAACGRIIRREDFFKIIGEKRPNVKCLECDKPYPECKILCKMVR